MVIDELHNIVGAGHAEGTMNAANILKPSLARGEIRVLGSTTITEYRKFIEKDSALERRFQKVMIEEPSKEDTIKMLLANREYYEKYHNVTYSEALVHELVRLADQYISERFFPDKAFDIIDEAGSYANLLQVELMQLQKAKEELETVELNLKKLEEEIEKENQNSEIPLNLLEKNAHLKEQKARLEEEIAKLSKKVKPREITINDVARVVELWTNIPVSKISQDERNKLLTLEDALHQRIIGQDEAVRSVSRAIRRLRSGFRLKQKPASFIFVGPSGVGKTELAKTICVHLHGTEKNLIRFDMSEYMEAHTVSKLIGSPPGYVGHESEGQLTEQVRRHPYSVILFDEIEKAHKDVYNMLLQILDDGRLTDSKGRTIDFSNCLIILTSNAAQA